MLLTPREKDKLLVALAAQVARNRLARGVKLNHPEAVALITDAVVEGARDGRSVAELMQAGANVLTAEQVMPGIPEMIHDIQVEATFPDGTKLVTVHHPIRGAASADVPGAVTTLPGEIVFNAGAERTVIEVANTGDRPIQVGSHYHFFEVNPGLVFERDKARGRRLDIAPGTAVRFEPGSTREVVLVPLSGGRTAHGVRVPWRRDGKIIMVLNSDLANYFIEELKIVRSRIDQEISSMNSNETLSMTYIGAIYLVYFQFKIKDHWFLIILSLLPIVVSIYGLLRYNSQRRIIRIHENYQKSIESQFRSLNSNFIGMATYYDDNKNVFATNCERRLTVKLKYARWVLWGSLIIFTIIFASGAIFEPGWLGSIHNVEPSKG